MPDIEITTAMVNVALDEWWREALEGSSDGVRDELKERTRERMRGTLVAALGARVARFRWAFPSNRVSWTYPTEEVAMEHQPASVARLERSYDGRTWETMSHV